MTSPEDRPPVSGGTPPGTQPGSAGGVSRRRLIAGGGGALALGAAAFGGGVLAGRQTEPAVATPGHHELRGEHQSGITTPVQDRLHFAALDVITEDRERLERLLRRWTAAAELMMRGEPAGGDEATSYDAPPSDTGEAIGLPASNLTITFGFGPSLFQDADGRDRFGLAGRRPEALRRLPHFPGDALQERRSDGDLCVQACADDPQVAVHAIRNLARIGFGTVAVRWSQLGFGRTSSTSTEQATPRNLFGFKDGTANLKLEQPELLDTHVWVPAGRDPAEDWLVGGSYLVARRISMSIETWDRAPLREQETIIGRTKNEGAPLSGGQEHTEPDFTTVGRGDAPLIDVASHVRLAHPSTNGGAQLLRRGYNFVDGADDLGRLDAGLFFLAYVTDPWTHYVPMQTRLAREDLLSEYLRHTGSGLWAVPGGIGPGEHVGQALFA